MAIKPRELKGRVRHTSLTGTDLLNLPLLNKWTAFTEGRGELGFAPRYGACAQQAAATSQ
jgi:hypothetical protein